MLRTRDMDAIRLTALAGTFAAALLGTLYAGASDRGGTRGPQEVAIAPDPSPSAGRTAAPPAAGPEPAASANPSWGPIPEGRDVPPEVLAMVDARRPIVDPETGLRLGPPTVRPPLEPAPEADPAAERRPETRRAEPPTPRRGAPGERRGRRARAAPTPVPRLHPDPGRHVVAVARRMIARRERIQGSCYRYLSEVFERAGHDSWRTLRVVYREGRNGPYADLDRIRPGDWLYIVNHPNRSPVGTHSVLFVGWEDRARGYARVIEHPGWGAPRAGRERGYDVSRTYRIKRPIRPGS